MVQNRVAGNNTMIETPSARNPTLPAPVMKKCKRRPLMSDVYQNLAKHLDRLPGGFPATESGVEIRILKHLFSPEEAELTVGLNIIPEAPEAIAARTGTGCGGDSDYAGGNVT